MVKCPECGHAMAVVMRYRENQKRSFYAYECPPCVESKKAAQAEQATPPPPEGGGSQRPN